jgi:hypothetical protein
MTLPKPLRTWRSRILAAALLLFALSVINDLSDGTLGNTPAMPMPLEVPAMIEVETPATPEVVSPPPEIAGMTP